VSLASVVGQFVRLRRSNNAASRTPAPQKVNNDGVNAAKLEADE